MVLLPSLLLVLTAFSSGIRNITFFQVQRLLMSGQSKLGFRLNMLFNLYFPTVLVLNKERANRMMAWIRRRLKYTPAIGGLYRGQNKSSGR